MSSGFQECPMNKSHDANVEYNIWEDEKTNKDETNRNRQSFPHITCEETFHCRSYLDKSMEGKWKRKKGPAPPCPIPHRRKVSGNLFIYFTSIYFTSKVRLTLATIPFREIKIHLRPDAVYAIVHIFEATLFSLKPIASFRVSTILYTEHRSHTRFNTLQTTKKCILYIVV